MHRLLSLRRLLYVEPGPQVVIFDAPRMPRPDLFLRSVLIGTAALLAAAAPAPLPAQTGVDCARCHADPEFLVGKGGTPAEDALLYVPDSLLRVTVHAEQACTDCHTAFDDAFPHQPSATTATCGSCHEEADAGWMASSHARALAEAEDGPDCAACHGVHDVFAMDDRRAALHPLNEAALCGECHADPEIVETYFTDPADSIGRAAVDSYHETVHGLAITEDGLNVSATCSDCHRGHLVLPSDSLRSSVHPDSIPTTCGTCHEGVLETFWTSAHGTALREGTESEDGHSPPTCTTCHSSHEIVAPVEAWKADVIEECGTCHERAYETYFHTHHGKVTRLGSELAAKCSDCHTPHQNLPVDDPASSISLVNRLDTCAECHAGASAGFASYFVHADDTDREAYPQVYWPRLAMSLLLWGVFAFFGLHSVLWLGRSLMGSPVPAEAPEGPGEESTPGDGPGGRGP